MGSATDGLKNPKLAPILFSILVKRLGGKVTITQADFDDIAYGKLLEEGYETGILTFEYVPLEKN